MCKLVLAKNLVRTDEIVGRRSVAVVFDTRPVPFAVREPAVDLDAVDKLGWGVALWLKAEDVEKIHDDLAEHGVRIVTAPFDGPFGRTFAFADPDGYVVTLHG